MPSLVTAYEVRGEAGDLTANDVLGLKPGECTAVFFKDKNVAFLICRVTAGYRVQVREFQGGV